MRGGLGDDGGTGETGRVELAATAANTTSLKEGVGNPVDLPEGGESWDQWSALLRPVSAPGGDVGAEEGGPLLVAAGFGVNGGGIGGGRRARNERRRGGAVGTGQGRWDGRGGEAGRREYPSLSSVGFQSHMQISNHLVIK